jgi:hypothetical protein
MKKIINILDKTLILIYAEGVHCVYSNGTDMLSTDGSNFALILYGEKYTGECSTSTIEKDIRNVILGSI